MIIDSKIQKSVSQQLNYMYSIYVVSLYSVGQ
jgi:hypothetical protein